VAAATMAERAEVMAVAGTEVGSVGPPSPPLPSPPPSLSPPSSPPPPSPHRPHHLLRRLRLHRHHHLLHHPRRFHPRLHRPTCYTLLHDETWIEASRKGVAHWDQLRNTVWGGPSSSAACFQSSSQTGSGKQHRHVRAARYVGVKGHNLLDIFLRPGIHLEAITSRGTAS